MQLSIDLENSDFAWKAFLRSALTSDRIYQYMHLAGAKYKGKAATNRY